MPNVPLTNLIRVEQIEANGLADFVASVSSAPDVLLVSEDGTSKISKSTLGTPAEREQLLREALSASKPGDIVNLGPYEYHISNTGLFYSAPTSSLSWSSTGVKLNLHPKTVLLYDNPSWAAGDADLFVGSVRFVDNFGAISSTISELTPPGESIYNRNLNALKSALASAKYANWENLDGTNGTSAHIRFAARGRYWFNETLRMAAGQDWSTIDNGGVTALQWPPNFAPATGILWREFWAQDTMATGLSIYNPGEIMTRDFSGNFAPHLLAETQRVRVRPKVGAVLPSPLESGVDYYIRVGGLSDPYDNNHKYRLRFCRYPAVSRNESQIVLTTPGSGACELIMMERFALVVDKGNTNGNSNTVHQIFLRNMHVSPYLYGNHGNDNFSCLSWRGAQNSRIENFNGAYCERGFVASDICAATVIDSLSLGGYSSSGTLGAESNRPAFDLHNCLGLTASQCHIIGSFSTGVDWEGDLVPAYSFDSCGWNHFRHISAENCQAGVKMSESYNNTIDVTAVMPGRAYLMPNERLAKKTYGALLRGQSSNNRLGNVSAYSNYYTIRDSSFYGSQGTISRSITGITTGTPCKILTAGNHGYIEGDRINVGGVTGGTFPSGINYSIWYGALIVTYASGNELSVAYNVFGSYPMTGISCTSIAGLNLASATVSSQTRYEYLGGTGQLDYGTINYVQKETVRDLNVSENFVVGQSSSGLSNHGKRFAIYADGRVLTTENIAGIRFGGTNGNSITMEPTNSDGYVFLCVDKGLGTIAAYDSTKPLYIGQSALNAGNGLKHVRHGESTLSSGTVTVTVNGISSSAKVIVSRKTAGGTVTSTIVYEAVAATNQITITAKTSSNTTNTSDTSIINWIVTE